MSDHGNLQKLTTLNLAPVTDAEPGPATLLQWLPISQMVIDPSYQRSVGRSGRDNIKQIARAFRWTHFAPVIVSPVEGGLYAIIDGQHRTIAAMLIGIEQIPCAVVIADRTTQAAAFHAVNAKTTRMRPTQIWHARLAAGDAKAMAMNDVCNEAGVIIVRSAGPWQHKPQNTMAIQVIEQISRLDRDAAIVTLRLIRKANQLDCYKANYLRSRMIEALFHVLRDHGEWRADEARLWNAFKNMDLDNLWMRAKVASAQIRGTTFSDQLQALFIDQFEAAFKPQRMPARGAVSAS
jgi:hypothetical protein